MTERVCASYSWVICLRLKGSLSVAVVVVIVFVVIIIIIYLTIILYIPRIKTNAENRKIAGMGTLIITECVIENALGVD